MSNNKRKLKRKEPREAYKYPDMPWTTYDDREGVNMTRYSNSVELTPPHLGTGYTQKYIKRAS
ncbi:hypothetical protein C922_03724 [Plasmodium inui San Antonio 1]|uniref:Uncharacterized protein n=1 Tax=Plasmodium inui San Antonio 1 TaxID=1237626 RepID=W6ZYQ7_9APIC|nr:hypothetical protein C922_03724 [Plasmodium inui San Antonio 1]EUD65997.1 hypothetical protein C922_03724 [Plasmodium inui San Antonio 1]